MIPGIKIASFDSSSTEIHKKTRDILSKKNIDTFMTDGTFVAILNDRIVGCIAIDMPPFNFRSHFADKNTSFVLSYLEVDQLFRRSGIAFQLMLEAMNYLRSKGKNLFVEFKHAEDVDNFFRRFNIVKSMSIDLLRVDHTFHLISPRLIKLV